MQGFLSGRHSSEHWTCECMLSSEQLCAVIALYFDWGKWGTEKLSNSPRVTQLGSKEAWMQTRETGLQSLSSWPKHVAVSQGTSTYTEYDLESFFTAFQGRQCHRQKEGRGPNRVVFISARCMMWRQGHTCGNLAHLFFISDSFTKMPT